MMACRLIQSLLTDPATGHQNEGDLQNDYAKEKINNYRPLHGDVERWRRFPSISRVDVGGRIAALSLFLGDAASV